jgi:hypothetical protein
LGQKGTGIFLRTGLDRQITEQPVRANRPVIERMIKFNRVLVGIPKVLINWSAPSLFRSKGCVMSSLDRVSGSFLAVMVGGLAILCGGLIAIAIGY